MSKTRSDIRSNNQPMPRAHSTAPKLLDELSFWIELWHRLGPDVYANPERFPRWTLQRYCDLLEIEPESFIGLVVVDVGCGPVGSLHHFSARVKVGVDPNSQHYQPFGIDSQDMVYLSNPAENILLPEASVDVVLSVNALDHVDDFEVAIDEISRVLRPGGRFLASLNMQPAPMKREPQMLTQARIAAALDGRFAFRFVKTVQVEEAPVVFALVVHATRLPTNAKSMTVQTTLDLIDRLPKTFWEQPGPVVELAKAQVFGTATRQEMANLHIQNAFLAWQAGQYRQVLHHVPAALVRDLRWAGNLGVLSIFMRSAWRRVIGGAAAS